MPVPHVPRNSNSSYHRAPPRQTSSDQRPSFSDRPPATVHHQLSRRIITRKDDNYGESNLRRLVFLTLHHPNFSPLARLLSALMGLTIFITCLGFVLSTMPRFQRQPGHCPDPVCLPGPDSACPESICPPTQIPALFWVEAVTVGIFTIDYVLRLACVHAVPERLINPQHYLHQVGGPRALQEPSGLTKTLSFTIQWMNIIDLLSFLPFYLGLKLDFGEENFVFLRLLRVMRVIRIFRLGRYTDGSTVVRETLRASSAAVGLMAFFMIVLTLFFAAISGLSIPPSLFSSLPPSLFSSHPFALTFFSGSHPVSH
ncbi:potassium voltage-gated channel subfamily d member 2 [Nannochloropsis gaditana]|uniref:Potassium voltage-gated channel subfamily d member 2 n=1 Tax=Nannochloropsis gaditana TaxID=72520 RepID=W7TBC2_9STRA|nr:potassium voltage-gated channel subfamily d member 2 [Nannochloropsis gaditana]